MNRYLYLVHHGIKGQKWGVRNGPPYPIEDKIMKTGTRLNSINMWNDTKGYLKAAGSNNRWVYTYNPDDEHDSNVYKGPFTFGKVLSTGRLMYEHQFETVKDLKMPTSKERIDEFINLCTNDKKTTIKDLQKHKRLMEQYDIGVVKEKGVKDLNLKKLKTPEDYRNAYVIFMNAMELGQKYASTMRYSEIMSKKYDAMVDDNNQGVYNGAHDPVIIFNVVNSLKAVGNAKVVPMEEASRSLKYIEERMKKTGDVVRL